VILSLVACIESFQAIFSRLDIRLLLIKLKYVSIIVRKVNHSLILCRRIKIMEAVLQFNSSNSSTGFLNRKTRNGPEWELIRSFTNHMKSIYTEKSTELAIFYEPLLDTGFPDLVMAEYDIRLFENWSTSRLSLKATDLKVLQHIHVVKEADTQMIGLQLGIDSRPLYQILMHLLDAGLIEYRSTTWKPISLDYVFGVRRLIAVEAKVRNWTAVFHQAQVNKWFASETYVLLPVQQPTANLLLKSEELGVGMYVCNHEEVREICPSLQFSLPSCYASWLFNEWIGRSINYFC
jgi:predicted transcriptional regulator